MALIFRTGRGPRTSPTFIASFHVVCIAFTSLQCPHAY